MATIVAMTGPTTRRGAREVLLDGHAYAIDLTDYEFGPQDTFRDGVTAGDQPSDALFNARGAWARYRISWHHGADQEIDDLVEEADPYRFDSSFGFDTWGQLGLRLLPAIREEASVTITSGNPILQRAGEVLYMAEGDILWYAVDLTPDSPWEMVATQPGTGQTILSLATDGVILYVAYEGGLCYYDSTSPAVKNTFSTPVTGATQKVAFAANRLLMGQDNDLFEVPADGDMTGVDPIISHFQAGFRWTTIFAIGSRIYVGGYVGVKSELYTLTTDSTGALVQGTEAVAIPLGEQLLCGVATAGSCLIGTTAGVRFAQVGADATLTYGPLIDKVGAVRAIAVEGRYAWVTWNNTPDVIGHLGLARLDLATFVDTLQPAYAADLQVFDIGALSVVTSVERYDDGTVFTTDEDRLFWAHDNGIGGADVQWATSASLTSGELFFGTVEPKGLTELEVRFDPLPEGATVTATVLDEDGATVATGTASTTDQTILTVALNGALVRSAKVVLAATQDFADEVLIHSWRMRAYPIAPQVVQVVLPIILHDTVVVGAGQGGQRSQRPTDVLARIMALHKTRSTVEYVGPEGATLQVRVEAFRVKASKWSGDDMAIQGLLIVQLVAAAT